MDGRRGSGVVVFLGIGVVHRCDKCAQINLLGVFFELHALQGHAVWEVCPIFCVLGRLNLGAPGGHIDFELVCSVFFRVALVPFESNNMLVRRVGVIPAGAFPAPILEHTVYRLGVTFTWTRWNRLPRVRLGTVYASRGGCFHDLSVDSWLELDWCPEDVSESG